MKAEWGAIAATDFFSVEVMTCWGIVRYHVFFVIDLKTRVVEIAGITHDLHQDWVKNALSALLDPVDGFLKDTRKLIHDRDPVFGNALQPGAESSRPRQSAARAAARQCRRRPGPVP
jgi:hypothetical protein